MSFRHNLLPKTKLNVSHTGVIIDSIIVSSPSHNVHTWCSITSSDWTAASKKLATAHACAVPSLITCNSCVVSSLTDNHFANSVQRRDAEHQVRRLRFILSPRLLQQAALALVRVLDASIDIRGLSFAMYFCKTRHGCNSTQAKCNTCLLHEILEIG